MFPNAPVFNLSDYQPNKYSDDVGVKSVRGFFYRIFNQQNREVGRLLGTLHSATREMLQFNGAMREALEKANAIYFEVVGGMEEILTPIVNLRLDQDKKMSQFIDLISPKLLERFKNAGLSSSIVDVLSSHLTEEKSTLNRYFMVLSFLNTLSFYQAKVTNIGIDEFLLEYGRKQQKGVFALEQNTLERNELLQAIMSEEISSDVINELPATETEVDNYLSHQLNKVDDLCKAWINGDEELFQKDPEIKMKKNNPYYPKLLERDAIMAQGIHEALSKSKEEDKPLFAVGVTHLLGGNSVINQLQEKGWKIVRV